MKILYTHLYDSRFKIGGAEQVVFWLARAMKDTFRDEVLCAVNCGDLAKRIKNVEIPVTEIFWSKVRTAETVWCLKKIVKEFQPDIVHSHHRYLTFLLDIFFKKSVQIVHTEHVLRGDKRVFFRYGHIVTAVHESVRQNLVSIYGVPENQVVTIPNAISLEPVDPVILREIEEKYPRRKDQIFALCIGRLEKQKGHRYLIEAIARLGQAYRKRIKIFLAGEGSLRRSLEYRVEEKGLSDNFLFLGHTERIAEYLAFCDFLVLPSLWEGMPLSILEAYGVQKPVIATNIAGSRELVKKGETGFLVNPGEDKSLANSIQYFLDHSDAVNRMGKNAYEYWHNQFSFPVMIERYRKLYQEVMDRGTK